MRIRLRFYGGFSVAAGTENAIIELAGDTLGALLVDVGRRWPNVGRLLAGAGRGSAVLVLNGRALEPPDPLTKLNTDDAVSIMPFVAGG